LFDCYAIQENFCLYVFNKLGFGEKIRMDIYLDRQHKGLSFENGLTLSVA
jgi:hypothetical protein